MSPSDLVCCRWLSTGSSSDTVGLGVLLCTVTGQGYLLIVTGSLISMSDQRVFCNDLLRFALNLACLLSFNILTNMQILS